MAEEFNRSFIVNVVPDLPAPADQKHTLTQIYSIATTGDLRGAARHGMISTGMSSAEADGKIQQVMQTDISTLKPIMRQMAIATINGMNVSDEEKDAKLVSYLHMIDQITTLNDLQSIADATNALANASVMKE